MKVAIDLLFSPMGFDKNRPQEYAMTASPGKMGEYLKDRLQKLMDIFTDISIFLYLYLKNKSIIKRVKRNTSGAIKIIHYNECRELGGTLMAVKNLVNALDKTKFKNYLFNKDYPDINELKNFINNNDIEISNDLKSISHITKKIRRIKPDIVHLHLHWVTKCTDGLIGAKMAGVKYLAASDYHVNPIYVGWSRMFRKWLFNYLVNINITETEKGKEILNKFFWIRKSRIKDILVGIPLKGRAVTSPAMTDSKYFIIGMVAMFYKRKGHEYLFYALKDILALYPDVRLHLYSFGGEEEDNIRKLSSGLCLDDYIFYHIGEKDLTQAYNNMDIFVFPSLEEGQGIVLLEAMSYGKAVVTTDIKGCGEVVRNGIDGILVPPADYKSLRDAIVKLIENKDLRKTLGENARKRAMREFSVEKMADEYENLYCHLLG